MSKVTRLPAGLLSRQDRERLESFGGHTIARGRATRWHWAHDENDGSEIFEIFRGSGGARLAARIRRRSARAVFVLSDGAGALLSAGPLEHVLAEAEAYFEGLHGELLIPPS